MWRIRGIVAGAFMRFCHIFPIKEDKIIFVSYYGKYYNDSPRMIYEKMQSQNPYMDYYWLFDHEECIKGAKSIKIPSFKAIYHLSTAKVWVDNCRKAYWTKKRSGQIYIQTWHADITYKYVEKDTEKTLDPLYVKSAKNDSKMIDIFLSGSKWATNLYRNSFWYKGFILESGVPRSDKLFIPMKTAKSLVSQFYRITEDVNFLLYAPTFRKDGNILCYNIDFDKLKKVLEMKFGGEWKIIIRLHPNINYKREELEFNSSVIDGTLYDDINELIVASKILITDYSSCLFDAIAIDRIAIIYAPDIEDYANERGGYFELASLPVSLATQTSELESILRDINPNDYVKKYKGIKDEIESFNDGSASSRVVEYLINNCLRT